MRNTTLAILVAVVLLVIASVPLADALGHHTRWRQPDSPRASASARSIGHSHTKHTSSDRHNTHPERHERSHAQHYIGRYEPEQSKPRWGTVPAETHHRLSQEATFKLLNHPIDAIAARAHVTLNCSVCQSVVALLLPLVKSAEAIEQLVGTAIIACEEMKPMCSNPTACAQVCKGMVEAYEEEVLQLLWTVYATPQAICSYIDMCPALQPTPPATDIPVRSDLTNRNGELYWPSWGKEEGMGTFVHLSDVHLDLDYVPGSNTQCGLPVCCNPADGPATSPSNSAGFWGDYNCDTSSWLAQDVLDSIAAMNPPPDFILYTGDDPDHRVWEQSQKLNLASVLAWSDMINKTLGKEIPIFNTVGNHEAFPINQFAGPGLDSWLYDACVDAWAPFLPEDAQKTMAYGGYFQARVRPGLRVVSLNSNFLTDDNFWIWSNKTDGQRQLNWLADVLSQTRALGEKAIIICHAPIASWDTSLAEQYLAIGATYSDVIVNLFMGHTHHNALHVLHAPAGVNGTEEGTPLHVAYVGGSIVPFGNVNPGFLVFEYDRAAVASGGNYSALVQGGQAHWVDLPTANTHNTTKGQWDTVRFDWLAGLGTDSLDAAALAAVAQRLTSNSTLYEGYVSTMYKGVKQTLFPSALYCACDMTADTAAQFHLCLHADGMNDEQKVRLIEDEKAALC